MLGFDFCLCEDFVLFFDMNAEAEEEEDTEDEAETFTNSFLLGSNNFFAP